MNEHTHNSDRGNVTASRWRNGPPKPQAENFRLLRALLDIGQELVWQKLELRNQTELSKLENGHIRLERSRARALEVENSLPDGWMDRDNAEMLFLSNDEFELIGEIRKSGRQAASSLVEMLKQVRIDVGG